MESVHIAYVLLWELHVQLLQLGKRLLGFTSLHYDLSEPCPVQQHYYMFTPEICMPLHQDAVNHP